MARFLAVIRQPKYRAIFSTAYATGLRGKSDNAHRLHITAIDRLAIFLGREPTIADLSDELLNDVMQWCVDQ